MEEIWKDIKGYENLYQVSNLGNVKSKRTNKILYYCKTKEYLKVCLNKNSKRKSYFIHRLVAQAFIPNPNNFPCVNHKDYNCKNNNVNNLEWCTYKYNNSYGTHNIKKHISSILYFLEKDYSNEFETIELAKKLMQKINNL